MTMRRKGWDLNQGQSIIEFQIKVKGGLLGCYGQWCRKRLKGKRHENFCDPMALMR